MRLSRFSDYALRACLYLAAHEDRMVPISEIVRAYDLSQSNLMKVINQLVDGGILKSTRGRKGGVTLARRASEIRTGDVIMLMEGDTQLVDCSTCLIRGACGLVPVLLEAKRAFYDTLNAYSLADALHSHSKTLGILLSADDFERPSLRGKHV